MNSFLRKHLASLALMILVAGRQLYGSAFVPTTPLHTTTHQGTIERTTKTPPAALHLFRPLSRVASNTDHSNNGAPAHGKSRIVDGKPSFVVNGGANNGLKNSKVPFVIERLGVRPPDEVFKNIAEMCISVFFNDGKPGRAMTPWKEVQLSYLRMVQMADLRRRRVRYRSTNAMYVAYRVEEASSPDAAQSQPLILNAREIFNLNALAPSVAAAEEGDYVRTDVLGFCEVSMVPFGLIPSTTTTTTVYRSPIEDNTDNFYDDDDDNLNSKRMIPRNMRSVNLERPVLTNLAVKKEARSSGVGSKLLDACERTASTEWKKPEMVLEVEDENAAARKWYQKRGYRVLFSDPTSKRYDVNGFFLKKRACTRQILRKSMSFRAPQIISNDEAKTPLLGSFEGVFRRLRENVLQAAS